MDQFPDQNHLASWAGVCPGSNESAGKNKSGLITYGNKFYTVFWSNVVRQHKPYVKVYFYCMHRQRA